jgi:hypothetical protein
VLDVVFLVVIVALFALVALVARGVEKLGPPAGALAPRSPGIAAAGPAAADATRSLRQNRDDRS